MSKGHKGKKQMPTTGTLQKVQAMATSLDPNALLKQLNLQASKPLIEQIEKQRKSRVLSLAYNESIGAQLAPTVIGPLEQALRSLGQVPRLDLFLISTGGMAEVPYRIVCLLREFTDDLGAIVPRMALSGATHIAIAADDLVMTAFSCLGSVDPKTRHPLLPPDKDGNAIPTSVQELKHCVEFISDRLGADSTSHDLALIIGELFQHINPLAIGAMEQSYHLSRLITEKVLRKRKKPLDDEHIKKIVDALAGKYFSHSFLISRTDVETDLGLPVTRPDKALTDAIYALEQYYMTQFGSAVLVNPAQPQGPTSRVQYFLQTNSESCVASQLFDKDGAPVGEIQLQAQAQAQAQAQGGPKP